MIEGTDLRHAFGDVPVLEGIDLSIERGEFVALVGPNGAGKTTLLRLINGILTPDSGRITLDGDDVADLSSKQVSRRVATVPQDTHIGFSFSAEQIVEMGRTPHRSRLDWSDETDPVERALERTEMLDLRDRQIDDLSGGERQRVLLARALAQEPDALVLDEPTANLDINHQIQVLNIVETLVAEDRAAVAAIHDLDLAARFCDRIVVLSGGEIAACGEPQSVLTDGALETAFDTRTAVTRNPATGAPTVTAVEDGTESGRVHITGSGQRAKQALRVCWRAGYDVSLGPVPAGDVAAELASQLGCPAVTAPAFRELDQHSLDTAREYCREADVLVQTEGPGREILGREADIPRIHAALRTGTAGKDRAVGDGGNLSESVARIVERPKELRKALQELTRAR